jgi:hypothetical protein
MSNDIANRWARDEVRELAREMYEQAKGPKKPDHCGDHQMTTRAIGLLLTGLDVLIEQQQRAFFSFRSLLALSLPLAAIVAGLTFAVGKLLGM